MNDSQKRDAVADCVTEPSRVDAVLAQKRRVSLEVLGDLGMSDEQIARYFAAFPSDMCQDRPVIAH